MFFIFLLGFSALFVAFCAAFFSIKGLIVLFSGSALAIAVMASSLEIGKLMAASFLHRHWKTTSFFLKVYLCVAVFVLMGITSMGIFGFLTGAYQQHAATVNTFEAQAATLAAEKVSLTQAMDDQVKRVEALGGIRAEQEIRVKEAGNYKLPREQAYAAIQEANAEIKDREEKISATRARILEVDKGIETVKIDMNTKTDIGSFQFIAKALDTDTDSAVRYFIFALIFVFDPLAVSLVLALNVLLEKRKEEKAVTQVPKVEPVIETPKPIDVTPSKPATYEPAPEAVAVVEPVLDEILVTEDIEQLLAAGMITPEEYVRRSRAGVGDSVVTS